MDPGSHMRPCLESTQKTVLEKETCEAKSKKMSPCIRLGNSAIFDKVTSVGEVFLRKGHSRVTFRSQGCPFDIHRETWG